MEILIISRRIESSMGHSLRFVVSDYNTMHFIYATHHYANSYEHAAAIALKGEVTFFFSVAESLVKGT